VVVHLLQGFSSREILKEMNHHQQPTREDIMFREGAAKRICLFSATGFFVVVSFAIRFA
jgi:hypothetical protein